MLGRASNSCQQLRVLLGRCSAQQWHPHRYRHSPIKHLFEQAASACSHYRSREWGASKPHRATIQIPNWPITPLKLETLQLCCWQGAFWRWPSLPLSFMSLVCVCLFLCTCTILPSCICHPNLCVSVVQLPPLLKCRGCVPRVMTPRVHSSSDCQHRKCTYITYRKLGKGEVLVFLETPTGRSVPHMWGHCSSKWHLFLLHKTRERLVSWDLTVFPDKLHPNETESADIILAISDVPLSFTKLQVPFCSVSPWITNGLVAVPGCWHLFEYGKNQSHSIREREENIVKR